MMKIDGACYCGAITYEADVDPEKVFICNCTDCQRMSGSVMRVNVQVEDSDIKFSGGAAEYIKTAESGHQRAIGFFRNCGNSMYATGAGDGPRLYGLRVFTSNQRDQLVPKAQVWTRSRPGWFTNLDNIPGKEKQ
jgi:hypothetical protein